MITTWCILHHYCAFVKPLCCPQSVHGLEKLAEACIYLMYLDYFFLRSARLTHEQKVAEK